MGKESVKLIDFTKLGIDTKLFSPAANYFKKHGRYYDHTDFEYWDEEYRRCVEGYSVTSKTTGHTVSITGEHYCYLNYCRIKLTDDPDKNKQKKVLYKKAITKEYTFADFWDGDYIYYWLKIIARFGASDYPQVKKDGGLTLEEFNNLHLPDEIRIKAYTFEDEDVEKGKVFTLYGSGKNLVIGKKRRGGYSYKMANGGSRRYHFFRKATTLLAAYDATYLMDDALMTKTVECIDHIDKYTPFTKGRVINLDDHKQCGRKQKIGGDADGVGGVEVISGRLSQVIAGSFRANKALARGKDADEIYVEESGKAPNLLEFTDATMDTLSDGIYSSGQIIWFGTGGGDNTDWEGFKTIFYNPSKYNCLEFENVWDEDGRGTYCGLFIPDYWTNVGFITENGESLVELAKEYEIEFQKVEYIDKGDIRGLVARRMEHPHSPAHAFAVSSHNIFDVTSIREWRLKVERERLHTNLANVGKFVIKDDGTLKFELDNTLSPFWEYPIDKNTPNKTGAVVIWYEPLKTGGIVPAFRYIIDVDSYRYDESTGASVGACYVKIRPSENVPFNLDNRIVAQYIGRPRTKEDFCKIVFQLADYYNAKIGYENDDQTLLDYAKQKRFELHRYFEDEFQLAFDEKIATSKSGVKGRKFGMHIGSGKLNARKYTGDEYIKDWIEEVRGTDSEGRQQLNLHTIYDIGLLKELESYNPEKGNFDRIAALRIMMYHEREIVYTRRQEQVKKRQSQHDFFNHKMFA